MPTTSAPLTLPADQAANTERVFVTGTVWNGRAGIRAAFDNWRTTGDDVVLLQEAVRDVMTQLQLA